MAGANKVEFRPLLPAGFHGLDAEARKRLCLDRFSGSITRTKILRNVEAVITIINAHGIAGEIWIDGSFVTEKLNPDDADLAFIVAKTDYAAMSSSQLTFFNQFRTTSYYETHKIDNYGVILDLNASDGTWQYAYWLRQFGFSRSDEMKGIIQIKTPFLVTP